FGNDPDAKRFRAHKPASVVSLPSSSFSSDLSSTPPYYSVGLTRKSNMRRCDVHQKVWRRLL
ncbi:hypothetical protein Ccrd_006522, partial [Cynara cardunculus var. scolymus]